MRTWRSKGRNLYFIRFYPFTATLAEIIAMVIHSPPLGGVNGSLIE
nr:MAG TPA: hypothetical protein [Caudoviricetes sp.]